MARVPIKLFYGLNTSINGDHVREGNPVFTNATIDSEGNLGRRPGLASATRTPDTIGIGNVHNVYYWAYAEQFIFISNTSVVDSEDATFGTATNLDKGANSCNKVSFAEGYVSGGTNALFFVGDEGTNIYYLTCASPGGIISGLSTCTGTPATMSSLVWSADRLLVNDTTSTSVYYSDVGDGATFSGGLFSAEVDADFANAIARRGQEILVFGERTIETYYNSGAPFERYQGGEIFSDCGIAPYTIVPYRNTYIYMDTKGRVNILNGREAQVISSPIDLTLYDLESDNMMGNLIELGDYVFYTVSFQTGLRTFAFDLERGYWSEWLEGEYGGPGNPPTTHRLAIVSTARDINSSSPIVLVAPQAFSALREMKLGVYTEDNTLGDYGAYVNVETPFIDHGSDNIKRSNKLSMRLSSDNTVTMQHKDEIDADYGESYDLTDSPVVQRRCLGSYRTRSYKFESTDNARLSLGSIFEDVEENRH